MRETTKKKDKATNINIIEEVEYGHNYRKTIYIYMYIHRVWHCMDLMCVCGYLSCVAYLNNLIRCQSNSKDCSNEKYWNVSQINHGNENIARRPNNGNKEDRRKKKYGWKDRDRDRDRGRKRERMNEIDRDPCELWIVGMVFEQIDATQRFNWKYVELGAGRTVAREIEKRCTVAQTLPLWFFWINIIARVLVAYTHAHTETRTRLISFLLIRKFPRSSSLLLLLIVPLLFLDTFSQIKISFIQVYIDIIHTNGWHCWCCLEVTTHG